MITHVDIENFKCFQKFAIDLDPFTVLIGPNDSGKTAFLQAIRLASALPPGPGLHARQLEGQLHAVLGRDAIWHHDPDLHVRIVAELGDRAPDASRRFLFVKSAPHPGGKLTYQAALALDAEGTQIEAADKAGAYPLLPRAAYYRFSPAAMRKATPITYTMQPSGEGLPTFLDSIWRRDRQAFTALEECFYGRFPEYTRLMLPTGTNPGASGEGLLISFVTRADDELPADAVSDGALISLAYMALAYHPDSPDVLLIEEPENGVHHARLEEIIQTLRMLNREKGTQVILTTHSPYLLDLVEPEEVRVFAKDDEGAVHARRLSEYPDIDSIKKHFMSGEIWTNLSEREFVLGEKAGA